MKGQYIPFPDVGRRAHLLSTDQMAKADALAIQAGVTGLTLMEAAGAAVAEEACQMLGSGSARYPAGRVIVLCGPGNNGGDGFVAARHLEQVGIRVSVHLAGGRDALKGDAAAAANAWARIGAIHDLVALASDAFDWTGVALVIDCLFGAGLSRGLEGAARTVANALNRQAVHVLAVDVPSGLSGDTGAVVGDAVIEASRTVTFFRFKPGHVLYPGRALCGDLVLADIGIPDTVLEWHPGWTDPVGQDDHEGPAPFVFGEDEPPPLIITRRSATRRAPAADGHKYDRGHAVVLSGPAHQTGAARLSAMAAQRAGAGLVTVAASGDAVGVNAAHLTSIMLAPFDTPDEFVGLFADTRRNVAVLGPGAGRTPETRASVLDLLQQAMPDVVLDADALTVFDDAPSELFETIQAASGQVVLTPHDGEFRRLFPDLSGDKISVAKRAAERSGAVVVLKGADTVVAAPYGQVGVNTNAPPWLATAGSGDVLAGLIGGLLAQGLIAQHAAEAAVWMHGRAGQIAGPGLIAEDLLPAIKKVLEDAHAPGHSADDAT
ncbi:MAG: NAD(P)H-hydrate dehydratase [Pseudomonadota bacterium]